MQTKKVRDEQISTQIRTLHGALIDIVSVMHRPDRDVAVIATAGIRLERALFPLLVGIGRFGPIGVGSLAARVGRDYSTVSRQVAKLESLGLVDRGDDRIRGAAVTQDGQAMTDLIDAARERIGRAAFKTWDAREINDFVRLTRKFADAVKDYGP